MAKLELKEAVTLHDADSRKLLLREIGVLEESRLVRAMGDSATNPAYMGGYVIPACMVAKIDDTDLPMPRTEREVEAAISQVGRHGLEAVLTHLQSRSAQSAEDDLKK
ncbi:MAG: hypothetical protein KGI52_14810 [Burkholderiales bacterium]|nr:hypothetical protein [Burkholderiales bacterium]